MEFCLKWEREDQELSNMEITRRVTLGTLEGVEEFLTFTMETGEDFGDNWLPTLDTSLHVNQNNQVLYRFYEKPTASNVTVQRRTAMGEDALIQTLSNDLVRRLQNNSEEQGASSKILVVDDYAQKLYISGSEGEQVRRIILNGIKEYEGKRRRCAANNWALHRTARKSQGARQKRKRNWFKKKKKVEEGPKVRHLRVEPNKGPSLCSF